MRSIGFNCLQEGQTALHKACLHGQTETVVVLERYGAKLVGSCSDVSNLSPGSGWPAELIGKHVALFSKFAQRFVQMRSDGTIGMLNEASHDLTKGFIESWRSWERFLVVDAGGGKIALHNPYHNRFIRMSGEYVEASGVCAASSFMVQWEAERFTLLKDSGTNCFAFHNALHNRFIQMTKDGSVSSVCCDVSNLLSASDWPAERFVIVPHPLVDGEFRNYEVINQQIIYCIYFFRRST